MRFELGPVRADQLCEGVLVPTAGGVQEFLLGHLGTFGCQNAISPAHGADTTLRHPDGPSRGSSNTVARPVARQVALLRRRARRRRGLARLLRAAGLRRDRAHAGRRARRRGRARDVAVPTGIAIALLTAEREDGAYAVALEADADIPSGETIVTGSFEQWHGGRHLGPLLARELSFVASTARRSSVSRSPAASPTTRSSTG